MLSEMKLRGAWKSALKLASVRTGWQFGPMQSPVYINSLGMASDSGRGRRGCLVPDRQSNRITGFNRAEAMAEIAGSRKKTHVSHANLR